MLLADLLFVLLIAIVFTLIMASTTSTAGGYGRWITFFLLFLLLPWAGALWLPAYGPALFGGYWVAPLVIAVFLFLIIAAFTPRRVRRTRAEAAKTEPEEEAAATALSVFFWILIGVTIVSIIVGYIV